LTEFNKIKKNIDLLHGLSLTSEKGSLTVVNFDNEISFIEKDSYGVQKDYWAIKKDASDLNDDFIDILEDKLNRLKEYQEIIVDNKIYINKHFEKQLSGQISRLTKESPELRVNINGYTLTTTFISQDSDVTINLKPNFGSKLEFSNQDENGNISLKDGKSNLKIRDTTTGETIKLDLDFKIPDENKKVKTVYEFGPSLGEAIKDLSKGESLIIGRSDKLDFKLPKEISDGSISRESFKFTKTSDGSLEVENLNSSKDSSLQIQGVNKAKGSKKVFNKGDQVNINAKSNKESDGIDKINILITV